MDKVLFEERLRELDSKFRKENQKISLIIDNRPVHLRFDNFYNVHLIFLPPNTSSVS